MPLLLFKDKSSAQRAVRNDRVLLSDPMEVDLSDQRFQKLTLSQIATRIQKSVGDKEAAIGVGLLSIRFALIADPEKVIVPQEPEMDLNSRAREFKAG